MNVGRQFDLRSEIGRLEHLVTEVVDGARYIAQYRHFLRWNVSYRDARTFGPQGRTSALVGAVTGAVKTAASVVTATNAL